MNLNECPYCKREATSYAIFCNTAYLLNPNKECMHCLGPIKLNSQGLFFNYVFVPIIVMGTAVVVAFILSGIFENQKALPILAFLVIFSLQFVLPELIAKKTSIDFYYPKVDVLEYRSKMPNYLKYDPAELTKNSEHRSSIAAFFSSARSIPVVVVLFALSIYLFVTYIG